MEKKSTLSCVSNFTLYSGSQYEVMLTSTDSMSRRHWLQHLEDADVRDEAKELSYSLKNISDDLLWHILNGWDKSLHFYSGGMGFFIERKFENFSEKNLLGLIKLLIPCSHALLISTDYSQSVEFYQTCSKSYLFNLAYNFDLVLKSITSYDELFLHRTSLHSRRNGNISEIVAPQLSYKQELVEQYYMALTSEDSFVKFIGFYHIMENFYEEVYNEDMFKSVQSMIQHPGFSSKRMKDIGEIVALIKKKNRQNKEEFQGSELEALELTLKKFIDLSDLVKELDEYDAELVDYYKKNEVSFSKGDAIDLRDTKNDKLYKKLAARIYKTRNALVHNKSNENRLNERCVYKPFVNSKELMREIPLMRYISEAIIIHSAKEL